MALRRFWPLGILLVAAVVSSCGGGGGSASGSPEPTSLTQATRERAGVRLTLSVDRAVYKPGQKVKVRAEAVNISGQPLTYGAQPPGQPIFALAVVSEIGGQQLLNAGAQSPAAGEVLAPGAKVRAEAEWDQMVVVPDTPVAGPPGKYAAQAQLVLAGPEGAVVPVSAAVTFQLEGGKTIVPPQDALKAALAADEIKAWFKDKSPTPVCAYPGRGLFFIGNVQTGTVNESLDIVYQANQANGYPICSILTSKEGWWLLFFGKEGTGPQRIMAWVDLYTGALIRTELGGPTPAPATPAPTLPFPVPTGSP